MVSTTVTSGAYSTESRASASLARNQRKDWACSFASCRSCWLYACTNSMLDSPSSTTVLIAPLAARSSVETALSCFENFLATAQKTGASAKESSARSQRRYSAAPAYRMTLTSTVTVSRIPETTSLSTASTSPEKRAIKSPDLCRAKKCGGIFCTCSNTCARRRSRNVSAIFADRNPPQKEAMAPMTAMPSQAAAGAQKAASSPVTNASSVSTMNIQIAAVSINADTTSRVPASNNAARFRRRNGQNRRNNSRTPTTNSLRPTGEPTTRGIADPPVQSLVPGRNRLRLRALPGLVPWLAWHGIRETHHFLLVDAELAGITAAARARECPAAADARPDGTDGRAGAYPEQESGNPFFPPV